MCTYVHMYLPGALIFLNFTQMTHATAHEGTGAASKVVYLLIVSWVLYPFTTYWMCLPVPNTCKNSFLWKWVMDVKRNQG